jgi:hypothetical protein
VGGNDGLLVGSSLPLWVPGRLGSTALSFRGNGSSTSLVSAVQTNIDLGIILGSTASLTAWIKTTQTGSDTPYQAPAITGVERSGNSSDVRWGYIDATGHIGVSAGNNNGAKSTTAINDGTWHQVAFTRDATTGLTQVYVDGVFQASAAGDAGTKDAIFRLIGAQSVVQSDDGSTLTSAIFLNGQLDDLRIFNRVLSAGEIATLGQIPPPPDGLSAAAQSGSMIQLNWTNHFAFATGVEIDRRIGATGSYAPIATLGPNSTQFNDTGLDAGTQYFYKIRAVDLAGTSAFSGEASATPPRPTIVGRWAFYNRSSFDGQNGSSNVADGFAVAPDKQALLPGQTATFANYTSYDKGLNGIMIDIANFQGVPGPDDYTLLVGNNSDPSTWTPAPTPTFITGYLGSGVDGSTRLEIVFDDNDVQNEWLQVTLHANANTDLLTPDVFYFGNAIGEAGDSPNSAAVNAIDELAARAAPGPATLANPYDFNRDGVVDLTDQVIARSHATFFLNQLALIAPPALASGAALTSGGPLAVASLEKPVTTPPSLPLFLFGSQTNSITLPAVTQLRLIPIAVQLPFRPTDTKMRVRSYALFLKSLQPLPRHPKIADPSLTIVAPSSIAT